MDTGLLFADIGFLFRFLPVFLLIYVLTPQRYRNVTLIFGSILYYGLLEPRFVAVLFIFTILNWALAKEGSTGHLFLLVFLDLSLLAVIKILAVRNGRTGLGGIPLGTSFYLFKMISYQADLCRGKIERRPDFLSTAAYFVLFPQLLEGPIARYDEVLPGGGGRQLSLASMEEGLELLLCGVCMKILLADRLGLFFGEIGRIGYDSISTPLAWLGAYGYSFQLYYDFWAYSLMAAGIAMMLGFPFIENFRHPYAASDISDYFRRWHITLGRFFRDYVYIPLGGSRNGTAHTVLNLFFVWILTGLWHGQSANFLLWAGLLFCLIAWEKFGASKLLQKYPFLGRVHVLVLIPLTWVIFALPDPVDLSLYWSRLFPFFGGNGNVNPEDVIKLGAKALPELIVSVLFLFPQVTAFLTARKKKLYMKLILFILFWIAVYRSAVSSANPFLYLQF